jgi:hypothetical protein
MDFGNNKFLNPQGYFLSYTHKEFNTGIRYLVLYRVLNSPYVALKAEILQNFFKYFLSD